MTDQAASSAAGPSTGDPLLDGLIGLGVGLAFNRHLGVEVVELEVGRAVTRLPDDGRLHNHLGGVHAIAELAPVELAGALAVSGRLRELLERGYVPVVGELSVRYRAPARGALTARAEVGPEVVAPALAAADDGDRPRVEAEVEVTDGDGTVVAIARLQFVYLDVAAATETSAG